MSEAKKGLRVQLAPSAEWNHRFGSIRRNVGTLTSGRLLHYAPPHVGGFHVRVLWDGLKAPESWHLSDLIPATRDDYVAIHAPIAFDPNREPVQHSPNQQP